MSWDWKPEDEAKIRYRALELLRAIRDNDTKRLTTIEGIAPVVELVVIALRDAVQTERKRNAPGIDPVTRDMQRCPACLRASKEGRRRPHLGKPCPPSP